MSTLSFRVSYVSRLAKAVNVLAIRQVKQETGTTMFRICSTIGVNKLKNYHFHFPRNKISLSFLRKIVVYFMLHFWHS